MSIEASCKNGHRIRVGDQYAGKRARCPKCGEPVVFPALGNDAVDFWDEPVDGSQSEMIGPEPYVTKRNRARRKKQAVASSQWKLPVAIGAVALLLVLGGLSVLFWPGDGEVAVQPAGAQGSGGPPRAVVVSDGPNNLQSTASPSANTPFETSELSSPSGEDQAAVEKIVAEFLKATKNDDEAALMPLLTQKARDNFDGEVGEGVGDAATFKIKKISIDNGDAQALVHLKDGPLESPAFIKLRSEQNKWRVYGMGLGDPEELGPLAASMFIDFENRPEFEVDDEREPGTTSTGSGYVGMRRGSQEIKLAGNSKKNGIDVELLLSYEQPMGFFPAAENTSPPLFGALKISGAALTNATTFGHLELTAAADDQGNELRQQSSRFSQITQFESLPTAVWMSQGFTRDDDDESIWVPLVLDSPATSARSLVNLKGSVQVMAGGEIRDVVVPRIVNKLEGSISDPVLEEAGLSIALQRGDQQNAQKPGVSIELDVSGSVSALLEFDLTSGDGESLNSGWSRSGSGDSTKIGLMTDAPLSKDARLELKVAVGQRPVTVPFAFENADLPTSPENAPAAVVRKGIETQLTLSYEAPRGVFAPFDSEPLFATLIISGQLIADGTQYGIFDLKTATDDTGTAIALVKPVSNDFGQRLEKQYVDLDVFFQEDPGTLKLQLMFERPSQGARSLTLVGSLRVKGRESVIVDDIFQKLDDPLTDPRLKSYGRFKVRKPGRDDGVDSQQGLVVEFVGERDDVAGIELMDGERRKVNANRMTMHSRNGGTHVLDAGRQLPSDTKLKIIRGGEETTTEIPFEFKTHPLPGTQETARDQSTIRDRGRKATLGRNSRRNFDALKPGAGVDPQLVSSLLQASATGNLPKVRNIIHKNPELINAPGPGKLGAAPLHMAVEHGRFKVAQFLLDENADVDVRSKSGMTPLHRAAARGRIEFVKLLLEHGSDPKLKNNQGVTPAQLAKSRGNNEIAELLQSR